MSWLCNICGCEPPPTNKELFFPLHSKRSIPPGKYRCFSSYTSHFYSPNTPSLPPPETQSSPIPSQLYEPKSNFICFFCQGQSCKSEDFSLHPSPAIPGLHSDLFFNSVYASQRPSNYLIWKYNLIQTFKEKGIKMVVNCQVPGEHAICGPMKELDESGFAYSPALLRSEGIKVKICGWDDFGVPQNYEMMLEIVKEMTEVTQVKKKRVLVHCHAGNGRTGVVIACYMVYNDARMTYQNAINVLREKRKKAVERSCQEEYVKGFEMFMKQKRAVFSKVKQNIFTIIKNQIDLTITHIDSCKSVVVSAFNCEQQYSIVNVNYVPKLLFHCLERIGELVKNDNMLIYDLYKAINGVNEINDDAYSMITVIIEQVNQNDYSTIMKCENIVILTELMFIWMNECVVNIINPKKVNKIYTKELSSSNTKYMGDVISNFKNESESNLEEVLNYITDTLSKNEYETLKYIALFLLLIYPFNGNGEDKEKMENEYSLAEQKLIIFCLGYNLDIFIQTQDDIEYEKSKVEQTKSLLEMFMFYNKNTNKGTKDKMSNEQKQYEMYLELKEKFEKEEIKYPTNNSILLTSVRGKSDPFFNELKTNIKSTKEQNNFTWKVDMPSHKPNGK